MGETKKEEKLTVLDYFCERNKLSWFVKSCLKKNGFDSEESIEELTPENIGLIFERFNRRPKSYAGALEYFEVATEDELVNEITELKPNKFWCGDMAKLAKIRIAASQLEYDFPSDTSALTPVRILKRLTN